MLQRDEIKQEPNSDEEEGVDVCLDGVEDKPESSKIQILEYEQKLMVDTFDDDVLFVTARGLGIERLFLNHLFLYSDRKVLVLVLNTTPQDEAFFLARLKAENVECPPKLINADVPTKEREGIYLEGGVQFITSRILIVDLLTDRIPVEHVAGILVYRAHQVVTGFQESFILRLFRERKKGGFVKAFTDHPTALASLGALQRAFGRLYIRRVCLLPRFDDDVKNTLEQSAPVLVELLSDMGAGLQKILVALVELIRVCVRELKACTTGLDPLLEEETVSASAGLMKTGLEKFLAGRRSFLSDKQERVCADLEMLRMLLSTAEELDAYTLQAKILRLVNDREFAENSTGWLLTPSAQKMLKEIEVLAAKGVSGAPSKWSALATVLAEIKEEIKLEYARTGIIGSTVLMMTSGDAQARQLGDLCKFGSEHFMWLLKKQLPSVQDPGPEPKKVPMWTPDQVISEVAHNVIPREKRTELVSVVQKQQKNEARATKRKRKKAKELTGGMGEAGTGVGSGGRQTRLVQFGIVQYKKRKANEEAAIKKEAATALEEAEAMIGSGQEEQERINDSETPGMDEQTYLPDPVLLIVPQGEYYNILRRLDALRPNFVILYYSDVVTMRAIEVFKALHPELTMRVYVIMYRESTEEQRYLLTLGSEQQAFETLLREQKELVQTLLVPREYDVARDTAPRLQLIPTLEGDGNVEEVESRPKIIVDMREFNSELPTVIYKRGFDVVPATLEVGDYVLSPSICVERKALDDLTQSLQSGRVYKQAEQMLRHYATSILLVESNTKFEKKIVNGGPFQGELSRHCRDVRSQLALLVLENPQLRIVWSTGPAVSAELFAELKLNKPDPDLEKATSLKCDELGNEATNEVTSSGDMGGEEGKSEKRGRVKKANPVLLRQLAIALPGMGKGDVSALMVSGVVRNMKELMEADESELATATSSSNAQRLARFFDFNFSKSDDS